MQVIILTDIPSPYQVELFNELVDEPDLHVVVIYSRRSDQQRGWNTLPLTHEHHFLAETKEARLRERVLGGDLVVFSGYRPKRLSQLISLRNRSGRPWAFWGERPGYRFSGWLGRLHRTWALRELRSSSAPVWGIGEWAVEGYRRELSGDRRYLNVPYSSNLTPFLQIERGYDNDIPCRFLFSGSFIKRKGLDLLFSAFERLVNEGVDAELHLLGVGPLEKDLKLKHGGLATKVQRHGFKQWHDLASIYAKADILCAPSRYDGWGLVVVEGLAAGMPVIGTTSTGAARELVDGQNGWLIPAGDEHALYLAMKSAAVLSAGDRRKMSVYARKSAQMQDVTHGARRLRDAIRVTLDHWS